MKIEYLQNRKYFFLFFMRRLYAIFKKSFCAQLFTNMVTRDGQILTFSNKKHPYEKLVVQSCMKGF